MTIDAATPIAGRAKLALNEVALADEHTRLTWAELHMLINRGANALLRAQLPKGARIAVCAHNSVEVVVTYLAAMRAGISSVPLSFHLTAQEIATLLQASRTAMLFVDAESAAALEAAKLAGVHVVIGWGFSNGGVVESWREWLAAAPADEPDDTLTPRPQLHFTSGTTGTPKGVETPPTMLPQAATVRELLAGLGLLASAPNVHAPALMLGPHYHTAGLRLVRLLGGGNSLIVLRRFTPEGALQAIERHKVAMTTLVPTHFQRLLGLPEAVRSQYDLSSLRAVFHTGAACSPELKRAMIDWLGPILVEAYGGTECGTTALITSQEWLKHPGSVGRAAEPYEFLVLDQAGQPLAPGQTGNIYFRDRTGRGVVYYDNPELTRSVHIAPGVFTLGEIGHVDTEGYLFITDRASDMIVSGGVNIYPTEIEHVLLQHPEVADVAVIGVPNAEMGEEVKALIVPRRPQVPPSSDALASFTRMRIAGLKCPRSFDFVTDLGRNVMGKINKRALRRQYWPSDRTIGG